MFARKSLIAVATATAVTGGATLAPLPATAGPLAGATAGVQSMADDRITEVGGKKRRHHGRKGGRHHRRHRGRHHRGFSGPAAASGFVAGMGAAMMMATPRCRTERFRVYSPRLGRRVWTERRVCR